MFDIIQLKIDELRNLDPNFKVFGAESHQYTFNSKINEEELTLFEDKHKINIPNDYRAFLKRFGNGGCGPDYGLFKIESGIYDIPSNKTQSEIINLKNDFRFKSFWNLEGFSEDNYDVWEDEYDKSKWCDGMLRVSHLGCGMYANIVLNGNEKGNIWIDSRTNEGGIYPANYNNTCIKNDFFSWYLHWLESSIKKIKTT